MDQLSSRINPREEPHSTHLEAFMDLLEPRYQLLLDKGYTVGSILNLVETAIIDLAYGPHLEQIRKSYGIDSKS